MRLQADAHLAKDKQFDGDLALVADEGSVEGLFVQVVPSWRSL